MSQQTNRHASQHHGPKRILITGSGGPIGVNVTRSLRAAPEPMYLVGTDCNHYHLHLAITDRTLHIPPAREQGAYLDAICDIIARERIELVLPTHPAEVRALSVLRERVPARLYLPPHHIILRAQDKWQTHQRLAAAGIPVPRTHFIRDEDDLARCFDAIDTRPIWVRGAGVPGAAGIGVASLPCRALRHASAWVDHWNGWGYFIASEFLPGRNLTWCGLFDRGTLIACQSRERLEYVIPHVSPSGITGAPAVSRTVGDPALRQVGEAAVRALHAPMPGDELAAGDGHAAGPHGVFFVDLKEDAGGTARVTEVNGGRFGTTIHFYTEAGCNFPHLLVKLAYDEPIPDAPLIDPIAPNTYWIRTLDCGPALVRDLPDLDDPPPAQ